ncbi:VOC family protein [Primorskyibacter sp. S187A]|uniref:VOC family protein n=1 Tax=Primorskyibacter sp. S187A TaxID=3415130 RepID=UPI003C7BC607
MDYETISAEDFGASLRGLGLNLLVRDVAREVTFLTQVLGMKAHRVSADFAILAYGSDLMQLHADPTYASHPLHDVLPEVPPRGAGASLHAFETDPDEAEAQAEAAGGMVLQSATNKPHGLREACLLSPMGYAWLPSRPLTDEERKALS